PVAKWRLVTRLLGLPRLRLACQQAAGQGPLSTVAESPLWRRDPELNLFAGICKKTQSRSSRRVQNFPRLHVHVRDLAEFWYNRAVNNRRYKTARERFHLAGAKLERCRAHLFDVVPQFGLQHYR